MADKMSKASKGVFVSPPLRTFDDEVPRDEKSGADTQTVKGAVICHGELSVGHNTVADSRFMSLRLIILPKGHRVVQDAARYT